VRDRLGGGGGNPKVSIKKGRVPKEGTIIVGGWFEIERSLKKKGAAKKKKIVKKINRGKSIRSGDRMAKGWEKDEKRKRGEGGKTQGSRVGREEVVKKRESSGERNKSQLTRKGLVGQR